MDTKIFTQDEVNTIKNTICPPETNDTEMQLFLSTCRRTGLDPFTRQIYCTLQVYTDKNSGKPVRKFNIQSTIDGFRVVAERSGKYIGQLGPFWCGADGVWKDVWIENENPRASKVGILRSDFKEPLWGVAAFDSYCQTNRNGELNHTWNKLGDVMISKCAEALGLRKAFPNDLSGLYTADELAQATQSDTAVNLPPSQQRTVNQLPPPTEARWPKDMEEAVSIAKKKQNEQFERATSQTAPPPASRVETLPPDDLDQALEKATVVHSTKGKRIPVNKLADEVDRAIKKQEEIARIDLPGGDYVIGFGKNVGKKLCDLQTKDITWLYEWAKKQTKPTGKLAEFMVQSEMYLDAINQQGVN
jgi:phage recombination protein Bet